MKFRCERDSLVEALGAAGRAVANRGGALPVLAGVRAELTGNRLKLTGSDLELTIEVELEVAGERDGIAVLPSKIASDLVRSLGDPRVEVAVEGDEASITAGRFESSLRLLPADEFPRLGMPAEDAVTLAAKDFAAALHQVVPAASADDARPILTGVLMAAEAGGLRLVATDSYRLAVRDLPGASVLSEGQSVLVPSRALRELERLLGSAEEITLRLGEREATFEVGGVRLTTRLIEGEFPNYRGLIPASHPNRLTVGREALVEAVRRVKLMAREPNTPVRLAMSPDGLELVAITQDVGQAHEQLDAAYAGEDLTVAFNPDYLLSGVEVTPGDEITLDTVDAQKPAVIRSAGAQEFLYLLMPVRVS
ncbi:DNA polymerase III subunit beta [Aquihabitans sp. G128]|uniref:DNA polymerase III subunit beta n=1 Tax=Aquihabitans sp. G128 TaxID=2849779 RepID=UPI001C21925E|nr:DNA polymerase III subunit beta [Aquihabitans sp. G128]QXC59823.1 DNA polymerase III subunit beta [Aquihabitans sp. G128]